MVATLLSPENQAIDGSRDLFSDSALLLISPDLRVLSMRGNLGVLSGSFRAAAAKGTIGRGRLGATIRQSIDAIKSGRDNPGISASIPGGATGEPLRIRTLALPQPVDGPSFAVLLDRVEHAKNRAADQAHARVVANLEARIQWLEKQLAAAEDCLRVTIEEYESSTEELKCSYEELRTANEELQATSDELAQNQSILTATRDRLETLGRNLQNQNVHLQRQADEFRGALNSLGMPLILLGNDLRVRFFNRPAERLFHLKLEDEGETIRILADKLSLDPLPDLCSSVLDQLRPVERTIGSLCFQIRPHLTPEARIEGVLILVQKEPA
jgi:two-component system CheB/CheR fusion protein